jgi:predicted transcriptional regulator
MQNNRIVLIKIKLLQNHKTQNDIANELGVTKSAVSQFIKGTSKSQRFNNWVLENLGLDVNSL